MSLNIPKINSVVAWRWANGVAEGIVKEIIPTRTEIESKGTLIVRKGTPENPVLLIRHKSGNPVIKLCSEVQFTDLNRTI